MEMTLERMGRLHDKLRKREALAALRNSAVNLGVELEAKRPAHNWKSRGPLFRDYPPEVQEVCHKWLASLLDRKAAKMEEMKAKGKGGIYYAILVAVATQCALRECGKLPSFKELHIRKNRANRSILGRKTMLGMRDPSDPTPAPQLYKPSKAKIRRTKAGPRANIPREPSRPNQVTYANMEGV